MKDGCVTKLRKCSFKFCCSDKLGICLVFLITLLSLSPISSKAQDLMFKPPVNPHSGTVKHCCYFLIFHFYAAHSDIYSNMPVLKSKPTKSYIKYNHLLVMIPIAYYSWGVWVLLLFGQRRFTVIPFWAFIQSLSSSVYLRTQWITVFESFMFNNCSISFEYLAA